MVFLDTQVGLKMNTSISLSDYDRWHDWARRLVFMASIHVDQSSEWGQSDCFMRCGEAMMAVIGTNPFAEFRGSYSTEKGAVKLMKKHGCSGMGEVFEKVGNLRPINRLQAIRGDVGVVVVQDVEQGGYFTEQGLAVAQKQGMKFFDVTDVVKAYQVGIR